MSDRTGPNFCDEFEFRKEKTATPGSPDRAQAARASLEALFGGDAVGPAPTVDDLLGPAKQAPSSLDDLFKT